MTIRSVRRIGRATRTRSAKKPAKSFDDRNLIDSRIAKAEQAGVKLARKIITSLEAELGLQNSN